MKLLPSRRVLCTPYNHAPYHFMQSHIRKVYAYLAVTCYLRFGQNDRGLLRATAVTRGWNGYRNKSQHRKLTVEKKILPPLQQGFEPATFRSRVRRSNRWAIPAPPWRIWIAELFVTKPGMLMHHYKPECHVRKMGCYLQGQGHSNWVWVHTMKSWLFLLYVLNCWRFGDQLSFTVHVHKLECLVKRLLCCIQGQGHSEGSELQWMFARTISLIDQT